jgi:hypothetical protein
MWRLEEEFPFNTLEIKALSERMSYQAAEMLGDSQGLIRALTISMSIRLKTTRTSITTPKSFEKRRAFAADKDYLGDLALALWPL